MLSVAARERPQRESLRAALERERERESMIKKREANEKKREKERSDWSR